MDFASSTGAAENRTKWMGLLRSHLWCPDDLPSLWNRIEYIMMPPRPPPHPHNKRELHFFKIYSLVGNIKNDLVKYFMQHFRNGLIIDLINS